MANERDVSNIPVGVPVFQGELMFRKVRSVPKDSTKAKDNIVGHSETGHHHVAEAAVVFTTADAGRLFLRALGKDRPVKIVHNRSFDQHDTLVLGGGVWECRRAREATPEGWRLAVD